MPLQDAVGIKSKNGELLKIKEQVSIIWPKGFVLDDCVCVLSVLT